ncbi:MAG: methyltransferase domain-containing protein [Patescibacteria group bacterium]
MESSADVLFDEQWPIIAQVQTILDTRRALPTHWWEQIRFDSSLARLVSKSVGAGFYDSILYEDGVSLQRSLSSLIGQYRIRQPEITRVEQQVGQLRLVCKYDSFVNYTTERYNLKGLARIYRSVLAGLTSYPELVSYLGEELNQPSVVVDLCCGTGQISHSLFGKVACQRICLDLSPGMLQDGLRSGYLDTSYPYCANAEQLPLRQRAVNLMLLIFGLDTVERPRQVLVEISRVLAPAGKLLLVTPLPFRYTSDGIHFVTPDDRVGPGEDWLEDLTALAICLESVDLRIYRWGVSTYYHSDIRGLKQSAAFTFLIDHFH